MISHLYLAIDFNNLWNNIVRTATLNILCIHGIVVVQVQIQIQEFKCVIHCISICIGSFSDFQKIKNTNISFRIMILQMEMPIRALFYLLI